MDTKICTKCKIEKEISMFNKKLNKRTSRCKTCLKEMISDYYINNKEKLNKASKEYSKANKDNISVKKKLYYSENRDNILKKRKEFRLNNIDKFKEKDKIYQINNKEKINKYNCEYIKNKKKSNHLFKLSVNIRNLIWLSISKMGYSKTEDTENIIGCEFEYFKIYIESQFKDGMCWENYGDWHLDHKTPISWAKSEEDVINLNHYSNFQPMWAYENMSKGNRFSS